VSRKPVIAANWKMNHTPKETEAFITRFLPLVSANTTTEIILCPSYTCLDRARNMLQDSASQVLLGGQNLYQEENGAFTGETSASMLLETGCTYVILGHSERRSIFNESNDWINKKIKFALETGLKVIFCVGETLTEREANQTEAVLTDHVNNGLLGLDARAMQNIVVAYEPVWAIGTGKTATPEQAEEAHAFIRSLLKKNFNETVSFETRIQYGGSVKPENASHLMSKPNIDGALVGGASLKADSFADIVNFEQVERVV